LRSSLAVTDEPEPVGWLDYSRGSLLQQCPDCGDLVRLEQRSVTRQFVDLGVTYLTADIRATPTPHACL
jgi:hypothetical protein